MCLHKEALKCVFANEYSFQNPGKLLDELLMVAKTFETTKIQTEHIDKTTGDRDYQRIVYEGIFQSQATGKSDSF